MKAFFLTALIALSAGAEPKNSLTLEQYLEEVKTQNPDARSAIENVASYESRTREAEVLFMPEAYASYNRIDDQTPTAQPSFFGSETKAEIWKAGLRQQTEYGLGADLSFNSQRTIIEGVSPGFFPVNNFMQSSATLKLTQSLWRNGFGEATRAKVDADEAANEMNLLQAKFKLKTLLLNARNAYWGMVSFNQIVKLQQENVDRARKLRDYMNNRTRLKLFDDTDAMQAEASLQSRELELQSSLDDRAVLARQFNTLRGADSDEVQTVDGLPTSEVMREVAKPNNGHMSREDFILLKEQARAGVAQAKYAKSQIQPQLDLTATVGTNGRDGLTSASYYQSGTNEHPLWNVGLIFSVPLDFGMVRDLRRGYRQAQEGADALRAEAVFSEARAWNDLVKQKHEAQGRFERSLGVEKIQTELVKREQRRLLNGRATTFEALNFEQNLALAQIQRVRAQLALLQIHEAIKTFEVVR